MSLTLVIGRWAISLAPRWSFRLSLCTPPCNGCSYVSAAFGPFAFERM